MRRNIYCQQIIIIYYWKYHCVYSSVLHIQYLQECYVCRTLYKNITNRYKNYATNLIVNLTSHAITFGVINLLCHSIEHAINTLRLHEIKFIYYSVLYEISHEK